MINGKSSVDIDSFPIFCHCNMCDKCFCPSGKTIWKITNKFSRSKVMSMGGRKKQKIIETKQDVQKIQVVKANSFK